ncbi:MAG TPA: carboxypeptidase regulatory-like domain-containing protein, partial [Candidatus Hydrogenedentes bacterium]|nr:carboxypeptidase regulatory-like domain-containing protein [Candidatus Hydrogenedentota bacterium]
AVTVSLVAALALVLASAGVWAFKRQGPAEEKVAYGVNIEAEETQENELAEPTENFSASKAAVVSAIVEPVEETPVTEAASSGPEAGLEPRDVAPAGYPGTKVARGETDVIRGTVYGPAGKPLAGAKVWATRWAVGPLDTREDVTGADGRFRLRVPAGQWRVAARKGYLGGDIAPGFEGQLITVGMGLTFNKDIRMEKRGIVRGRILNKETGKPIPSGRILFDGALTTADADGRYLIEGVRQNTVTQRLYPRCPGYSYRGFGFSTLLCGETELDLRLARAGGRATGTVTDEAGRPLAHASVRAGRRWVVCDENGRFEADGIPFDVRSYYEAQLPCYVNICAQNLGETPYQWCLLDANSENLLEVGFVIGGEVPKEVRRIYPAPSRRPAGVIRGRVVDSSGRPVRDFQVRTTVSSTKALLPKDQIQWGGTSTYFTSEDGTFVIGGYNHHLRAGKITRVVVTADGYSQAALDTVTIEAFGAQTPGKEVLLRLSAARTLHVRVTEDAAPGKAVQGACVRVLDPNSIRFGQAFEWQDVKYSSERGAETDARGLACFNGLSLSRGTVAVQKDGYAAARVEWRSGESELRVALQPECRIEGLVLDGTGKPRDGYSVFLRYSRDGVFSMFDTGCGTFQVRVKKNQTWFRPEDAGRFRFDQLPAGVYTLYVSWLDYGNGIDEPLRQRKSYNDEFTLAPGQVLKVAYPEDAIADNPERWLAESVQDLDDGRLRQRLLGTWVRESVLPKSGRREWAVYYFGEDGSSQRTAFVEGLSDAIRLSGWFKVEQGCVKIQGDDGKCMTYTSAAFPSDDTLVLGTGHSAQPTLHRAASLDEALRKGESLLSAVTPVPRDQGLPKTSGDSHTRRGYFGR